MHGAHRRIMVLFNEPRAVAHDLIHWLHHTVRGQAAVFFAQIHAATGGVKAHPQLIAGSELLADEIARALNECRLIGSPVQVVEVLALLRSIEGQAAHLLPQLPPPPKPNRKGESDAH